MQGVYDIVQWGGVCSILGFYLGNYLLCIRGSNNNDSLTANDHNVASSTCPLSAFQCCILKKLMEGHEISCMMPSHVTPQGPKVTQL